MESKEFIDITKKLFDDWLNVLNQNIANRKMNISGEYSFANLLRIAESPTQYICELCGSKYYKPGQTIEVEILGKMEKVSSTTSFFCINASGEDNQKAVINVSGDGCTFSNLLIATKGDLKLIKEKISLPIIPTTIKCVDAEIPIFINPNLNSLLFNDIELLETDEFRINYRLIRCAIVLNKTASKEELIELFEGTITRQISILNMANQLIGLNTINSSTENFAAQLFSLSNQSIREPLIDRFIQKHTEEFAVALGYKKALSQKELKWIERKPAEPYISKPDYLLERSDGYCDILDLKTGAVKFKSITKSKESGISGRARMRFVDYAAELIAQLKDYESYFGYDKNKEFAYGKYGIKISKPRLIGVIGNYNNFDRAEVERALNPYKEDIILLSYCDIANMLRKLN